MIVKAHIAKDTGNALLLASAPYGEERDKIWVPRSVITNLKKKGFEDQHGERRCEAEIADWWVKKNDPPLENFEELDRF